MSADDQLPDVPALRVLEPPGGGLAALRDRLGREDAAPARRWWLAAIPLVALAVLALVLVRWPVPSDRVERAPSSNGALADRELGHGEVAFYWVASTPGGQNAGTRAEPPPPPAMTAMISIDDAPQVTVVAQP